MKNEKVPQSFLLDISMMPTGNPYFARTSMQLIHKEQVLFRIFCLFNLTRLVELVVPRTRLAILSLTPFCFHWMLRIRMRRDLMPMSASGNNDSLFTLPLFPKFSGLRASVVQRQEQKLY